MDSAEASSDIDEELDVNGPLTIAINEQVADVEPKSVTEPFGLETRETDEDYLSSASSFDIGFQSVRKFRDAGRGDYVQ